MTSPLLRLGAAAVTAILLAGCGSDPAPTATDDSPTPTETPAAAPACPATLFDGNRAESKTASAEATATPQWGDISAAWVCTYTPGVSTEERKSGWTLAGDQVEVTGADLDTLRTGLAGLLVPEENRGCTMDLGPRSLVLAQVDGGTVGIVMDHFGCRDVRLTSDPAGAVAGTTSDLGTVPGTLAPGAELQSFLEAHIGD